MRFDPKSEKEIAEANMWPVGEYDFEVAEAVEETSKAGNDMVHLQVKLYNNDGSFRTIDDYLVGTDKAAFKLRQFAEAVGLLPDYESGEISAETMVGRAGRCKLVVKKDTTGQFPDKNAIGGYLKPQAAKLPNGVAARAKAATADLDDEIPF